MYIYRENLTKKLENRYKPGAQVGGEATALLALILWANLMSSSDDTFLLFACCMAFSFFLAWYMAVD